MSQQNVDVVRGVYEAFARQDIPAILGSLADDVDWYVPDALPYGGRHKGPEGVAGFFQKLPGQFAEVAVDIDRYVASGDDVVALGRVVGRSVSGNDLAVPFAMVWTLSGGKIVRFVEHSDTAVLNDALK